MSYPRRSVIVRAVKAAQELGITVAGFKIGADGSIEVFDKSAAPADDFEQWQESLNRQS